ncbi:MAG: Ig-like domain-containing protein [Lachnospiraceae bacterium]
MTLDQSEITLENEGTMQLNAKVELTGKPTEPIEWNSEEPAATVKNGLVTAVGAGTTTITATCGEKTATCKVTRKCKSASGSPAG